MLKMMLNSWAWENFDSGMSDYRMNRKSWEVMLYAEKVIYDKPDGCFVMARILDAVFN